MSDRPSKVNFFYQAPLTLTNRTKLKKFIEGIFRKEKKKLGGLNYIFCSDNDLLAINQSYLGHDYFTDIITFEISDPGLPVVAEIYISVDRVRENAKLHHASLSLELHRVIFHGVLHLCGYRDKSKSDIATMRAREDKYLKDYF